MPKQAPLATRDERSTALVDATLAEMLGAEGAQGLENVGADEIQLPRLAILQPMSPLVTDNKARAGEIVNLLTNENFGNECFIYPLLYWTSRTQWASKDLNSEILCQARDGVHGTNKDAAHAGGVCANCPQAKWHEDKAPSCTQFKNILLVPFNDEAALGDSVPAVFSGKRASILPVNKFLSAAIALRLNGKKMPLWSSMYKLSTKKESNDKGTYYVPVLERIGYITSKEVFGYLKELYLQMKDAFERMIVTVAGESPDDGYVAAPADVESEDF